MERVGILGGTFDPVHLGHLLLAQTVREQCGLDRVLLMPCCTPPHKACGTQATAEARLAMVRLAVADDPALGVCTLEFERGGISYAVDTLRAFRARQPDAEPFFIMGMDSLRELHLWHRVEELLTLCAFVIVERPGVDRPLAPGDLELPFPWPERLLGQVIRGRLCDISSREIRRRIASGLPIRYLVPPAVEAFIRERGLYRTGAAATASAAQGDGH